MTPFRRALPRKGNRKLRNILLVLLLVSFCGCGRVPPGMAGSKWARALRSTDPRIRRKAAFTLGNIGPSDPAVLPALIRALKDPDVAVRAEAVLAISKYGSGAGEALPALTQIRDKDRDARVRSYAAKALEKLRFDGSTYPHS
jgi:hypothetical protein